jgi:fatty acid CoA ligase FadD36
MHPLSALRGDAPGADRPDAVTVGGISLSRARLAGLAATFAARIAGAPVLAVRAEAAMPAVVAVAGGLLAGVPVVPLPPDAGPDESAYMLADSGAALLVAELGEDLVPVPTELPPPPTATVPAAGTALVVYTSGTTGRPKGVEIGHDAIAANLDALAAAWDWTVDDTLVHGLPIFHVHGLVLGVLGPLRLGCRLVHTVRPAPGAYAAAGGTLYFGVPTVWSRVCAEPAAAGALAGARLLVSGSAPLPLPVFEQLTALTGQRPVERYGMTETLITCSTRVDGERRAGSVGLPLAGTSTRLAPAEDGGPPATGDEPGELEVRGPVGFGGYLGRPDATAAVTTADGWFRTGDIATVGPDGMHRIVGRASVDLIKSGGYRIGAGEIEDALLAHPGVREAAVVGAPHDDLGQEVVAYVVADGVTGEALTAFAAGRLSWHKRPRRIVFLDALPRNAMGKVRKQALRE